MRRLRVGLVELERHAGGLGIRGYDFGPLLEQQTALRLCFIEIPIVVRGVKQQFTLQLIPSIRRKFQGHPG